LAASGYGGFSFESVAARAGIAKTTVYRRYPTKIELVRAAIQQFVEEAFGEVPDTGTFRGDLVALGWQTVQFASSVLGQSLLRIRMLERVAPELDHMGQELEAQRERMFRPVAQRGVARGELASEAEFPPLLEVLSGALLFKLVVKRLAVDELEVGRVVDHLLHGVPRAARRRSPTRTSGDAGEHALAGDVGEGRVLRSKT
jgi:AcrR family transcriptional regulator